MFYWIIYDISRDRTRLKVSRACQRAGLHRVQKSVFLGKLRRKTLFALRTDFNRIVNWRTDKVFFVPMNNDEYRQIHRTGAKRQTPVLPPHAQPSFY
ncbi:MAG: CRISPR-associated endonuclease Cas2 [Saprospirales bacterium]|nr:CRISPR-associated endonuclease Cas2 [Saprospirales bacterium]